MSVLARMVVVSGIGAMLILPGCSSRSSDTAGNGAATSKPNGASPDTRRNDEPPAAPDNSKSDSRPAGSNGGGRRGATGGGDVALVADCARIHRDYVRHLIYSDVGKPGLRAPHSYQPQQMAVMSRLYAQKLAALEALLARSNHKSPTAQLVRAHFKLGENRLRELVRSFPQAETLDFDTVGDIAGLLAGDPNDKQARGENLLSLAGLMMDMERNERLRRQAGLKFATAEFAQQDDWYDQLRKTGPSGARLAATLGGGAPSCFHVHGIWVDWPRQNGSSRSAPIPIGEITARPTRMTIAHRKSSWRYVCAGKVSAAGTLNVRVRGNSTQGYVRARVEVTANWKTRPIPKPLPSLDKEVTSNGTAFPGHDALLQRSVKPGPVFINVFHVYEPYFDDLGSDGGQRWSGSGAEVEIWTGSQPAEPRTPIQLAAPAAPVAAPELRMWVSRDGKYKINASFQSLEESGAKLVKEDGRIITVPFVRLSDDDVRYARTMASHHLRIDGLYSIPAFLTNRFARLYFWFPAPDRVAFAPAIPVPSSDPARLAFDAIAMGEANPSNRQARVYWSGGNFAFRAYGDSQDGLKTLWFVKGKPEGNGDLTLKFLISRAAVATDTRSLLKEQVAERLAEGTVTIPALYEPHFRIGRKAATAVARTARFTSFRQLGLTPIQIEQASRAAERTPEMPKHYPK